MLRQTKSAAMLTLGTLLLGILIGVTGLLVVQHPGSIDIMRDAFDIAPSSPPVIRQSHPMAAWCPAHPQLPCR